MDPILVAAAHALLKAPDGTDGESFVRNATGGKYGYDDAANYVKSINTGVTPSNVGRSVVQGATMNFGDELMDQDPKNVQTGVDAVYPGAGTLAAGVLKMLGAHPGAGEEMRMKDEMFAGAHPYVNTAGRIAGSLLPMLAAPEAEVAAGASPFLKGAAAVAKGAGVGYGVGAASAAGDVDPGGDRSSALTSPQALISAVFGAAAPAAVGAFNYVARPAAQMANRLSTAIGQSKGLQTILEQLGKYEDAGLGSDVTLGDLSHPLSAARKFAVKNSVDAESSTLPLLAGRQAGQIPRLMDKAKELLPEFGDDVSGSDRQDYLARTRKSWAAGQDGFGGIRADTPIVPDTRFATSGEAAPPMTQGARMIANLLEGPGASTDPVTAARAIVDNAKAPVNLRQMASEYVEAKSGGVPGMTANPSVFDEPIVQGAVRRAQDNGLSQDVQAAASQPTFDKVLAIKNRLQGKAKAAFQSGDGDSGRAYAAAAQRVDQHLADNVPDYMNVTKEYAQRMGLERAVQSGMDAWNSGDVSQLLKTAQKMSPDELTEFRRGLASSMFQKLNNTATNGDAANGLLDASQEGSVGKASGATQAKLKLIFGDNASYDAFMKHAALEHDMAMSRASLGGSDTYQNLQQGSHDPLNLALTSMSSGFNSAGLQMPKSILFRMGARGARSALNSQTGTELGEALNTRGATNIRDFLAQFTKEHGENAPLTGKGSQYYAPAAVATGINTMLKQP